MESLLLAGIKVSLSVTRIRNAKNDQKIGHIVCVLNELPDRV